MTGQAPQITPNQLILGIGNINISLKIPQFKLGTFKPFIQFFTHLSFAKLSTSAKYENNG